MSKPNSFVLNSSIIYAHRRAALKPENKNVTLEEFSRHAYLDRLNEPRARSSLRSVDLFAARRAACTPSRKARGQEADR